MFKRKDIYNITVEKLINTAQQEDGKISEEEFEIIEQVSYDADIYAELLDQFNMKGAVTKQEAKILDIFKSNILENAGEKAFYESSFNEQKHKMIKRLANVISTHYKNY